MQHCDLYLHRCAKSLAICAPRFNSILDLCDCGDCQGLFFQQSSLELSIFELQVSCFLMGVAIVGLCRICHTYPSLSGLIAESVKLDRNWPKRYNAADDIWYHKILINVGVDLEERTLCLNKSMVNLHFLFCVCSCLAEFHHWIVAHIQYHSFVLPDLGMSPGSLRLSSCSLRTTIAVPAHHTHKDLQVHWWSKSQGPEGILQH